jgi:hypothetical protein
VQIIAHAEGGIGAPDDDDEEEDDEFEPESEPESESESELESELEELDELEEELESLLLSAFFFFFFLPPLFFFAMASRIFSFISCRPPLERSKNPNLGSSGGRERENSRRLFGLGSKKRFRFLLTREAVFEDARPQALPI